MLEIKDFVDDMLEFQLNQLASYRKTDIMVIYGPMHHYLPELVKPRIEAMQRKVENNKTLTIILDTEGGLVDPVERMVRIIRHHYEVVDFIIPDQAMSAGTVFALSADNIYMDYNSQLGPIDPQFFIDDKWVPGLSYLETFKELSEKSVDGTLTPLEYALAKKLDLAQLEQFEQAREHSVELLEKWLPAYKFRNWNKTESTEKKVTPEMKQNQATFIATELNNRDKWHSHSRGIPMDVLQTQLGLKINDLSEDRQLHYGVEQLHGFIIDLIRTEKRPFFLRTTHYKRSEDSNDEGQRTT